jgi:hypothetical protein
MHRRKDRSLMQMTSRKSSVKSRLAYQSPRQVVGQTLSARRREDVCEARGYSSEKDSGSQLLVKEGPFISLLLIGSTERNCVQFHRVYFGLIASCRIITSSNTVDQTQPKFHCASFFESSRSAVSRPTSVRKLRVAAPRRTPTPPAISASPPL